MGAPGRTQRSGPHGERSRSGKSEPCPGGRGEGCEACGDEAGPVLAYGISASVVYGIILCILQLF